MAKKKIIILGGGLSGLSTAWHLQKSGIDCQLLEKEAEVGGLCRSKKINGFTFDYDGHLLHFKSDYALELVSHLLKDNLVGHCKSSWVYSHGRYTHYPFQANLYGLPSAIIKECLMGFIEISRNVHPQQNESFLDWINNHFGRGIAKHFMIPYNTKFWTLPPEDMECSWLDGVIPTPSLKQVIDGTIKENKKPLGYNAHFWYPKNGGIQQLPQALCAEIKNIQTGVEAVEIDLLKKQIRTGAGDRERYDVLISTIPLPEIAHLASGLSAETGALFKKLKWNSIFNLNLGVAKKDYLGRHWAYFPEQELSFFRAGFFHNFSQTLAPAETSSFYTEVSYSREKPLDKNKIVAHIIEDLKKVGILSQGEGILAEDVNDIKYGYPIFDRFYQEARNGIMGYLNRHDIIPVGRYGSWRYMSMEDVILDGRDAAKMVAGLS